jgi:SulP family sulfate permease
MHISARLRQRLPFLHWPRPSAKLLRSEVFAGLSVGLMVIPQGVAYAALAGMPLVTGIYASLLPALIAVLFSASTRLSVGPTALTAMLVSASLNGLAEPGSAQWVNLTVWLAMLTGLLQIVLGFARFGWLLNLVSSPVLAAFTQGAAVLIIGSQLPALLGMTRGWASLLQPGSGLNLYSLGFGIATLAILVLTKRFKPTFPTVLVVVLGAAGLSWALDLQTQGVQVVGALPQGLPALYLPHFIGWDVFKQLVLPTLVITLVSFLETASSAKVDNERKGQRWDQDQDLIGQGLGKLASGLCGAFPTSSSFSRSALNLYAGAQTGWATVVSVVVILLALLLFIPVLHHVPQSVLAAIVVAAVMGLLRPRTLLRLLRINRVEGATALLTFGITLASAPRLYWGVLAGVVMGLSHFLHTRLHPRIIEVGLHPDGSLRDRHLWKLPPLAGHLYALRMDAELDFAAASGFERAITDHLSAHPDVRHVCLFAQPVNRIDVTGVETFAQVRRQLAARGITLHISGIKLPVETTLHRAGELPDNDPMLKLYRTDTEALQAMRQLEPLPADMAAAVI